MHVTATQTAGSAVAPRKPKSKMTPEEVDALIRSRGMERKSLEAPVIDKDGNITPTTIRARRKSQITWENKSEFLCELVFTDTPFREEPPYKVGANKQVTLLVNDACEFGVYPYSVVDVGTSTPRVLMDPDVIIGR